MLLYILEGNTEMTTADWVSEFAPKTLQKSLSYIIGTFISSSEKSEFELITSIQVGFVSWVGKQVSPGNVSQWPHKYKAS